MKRGLIKALLALMLACPSLSYAQGSKGASGQPTSETTTLRIVVDLAEPRSQVLKVDAGTYQLTLMNAVPGRSYWLHIGPSFAQELPALSTAELTSRAEGIPDAAADPCSMTDALEVLIASATEEDVRKNVERLRILTVTADPNKCKEELEQAAKVRAQTSIEVRDAPILLPANAVRRLSISSRDGGHWEVELNSMGRGTWQTTYGFAFNPNNDEEYFAEAGPDSVFTVRKQGRDSGSLTLLPAVFFTWLPSSQALRNIQHGPTLGLGVTAGAGGGRFGALAGYTVRFNQNIGLVAGVSIYQHRRLDAQYEQDQVISENLTPDQLNEDSMRPNLFLALSLRLGSSPFGASVSESRRAR